jgi:cobaltochelatase CobT
MRGDADTLAVRAKYHDDDVHLNRLPHSTTARAVFEALEDTRLETLGKRDYIGVGHNIALKQDRRLHDLLTGSSQELQLADIVKLMARQELMGYTPPARAAAALDAIKPWVQTKAGSSLRKLPQLIHDQEKFARLARQIIEELELELSGETDQEEQNQEDGEQPNPQNDQENQQHQDQGNSDAKPDEKQQQHETPQNMSERDDRDAAGDQKSLQSVPMPSLPLSKLWETVPSGVYRAYATEFDEIVEAQNLGDAEERLRLRQLLDQYLSQVPPLVTQLANRLQRRLLAQQSRSWNFDLDEGLLDSGRLARVVANPSIPLAYKMEKDTDFRDTVVTLLLDNSGSMRGRPITIAALSADILARTLERCGVKVEILGFTTRSWKGGQPYEKWIMDGKPMNPGRLNDLRHIIYKSADTPWRRARVNLGVMLREGLLKENIDGEALLWAHGRLLSRPEQRKILMVISDGAPVDDVTTSANSGSYLEQHLREVIHWIEGRSPVELTAIGIGHRQNNSQE